jgi:hypothetical protein
MTTDKGAGFDWQTEDEDAAPDISQATTGKRQQRGHPLTVYALLLSAVALLAMGAYWQIKRRLQTLHDNVVAEVLLAHELIEQAAQRNDRELFLTLLSAGDGRWFEAQQRVFEQKLFLDRTPLGLHLAPDGVAAEALRKPQVSLTNDLALAEVTSVYHYLAGLSPGAVESVFLERTMFYAREVDTWARVPPPDENSFWGSWLREESEHLLLLFSARDAALGYRLYADLHPLVHEICRDALVSCPPNYKLRLRLSRDPATLQQVNGLLDMYPATAGQDLELPAPSLVGTPLDEVGYEALYRGYAGWVAAAIASYFNSDGFFSHEDLSEQLARWQLRPPPLPGYQVEREAAGRVAYPDQDVVLLCEGPLETTLIRLDLTSGSWQDELAGKLSLSPGNYATMSSLADGAAFLLTYRATADSAHENWRTLRWRAGMLQPLYEEAEQYSVDLIQRPGASYLLLSVAGPSKFQLRILNLESCLENDCELSDLDVLPAWSPDGKQTLAPVYDAAGTTLFLGDGMGQNLVPLSGDQLPFRIVQPFWLNDQTFVYMRWPLSSMPFAPGEEEIVIASINSDGLVASHQTITTINAQNLVEALPLRRQGEQLSISAMPNPRRPGQIVLVATLWQGERPGGRSYFFSFDYLAETAKLLYEVDYTGFEVWMQYAFSPNGAYLTSVEYRRKPEGAGPAEMLLHLYNQESQETWTYVIPTWNSWWKQQYDWSADGEWLLLTEPGLIRLLALDQNHEEFIYHRFQGCNQAAWVNR